MLRFFLVIYPICAAFIALAVAMELRERRRMVELCERIRLALGDRHV